MSHAFISTVDTTMSSLYRDEKDGENIARFVKNQHIKGLGIDLEYVIITFNHGFSVFNVCCGPQLGLVPSASHQSLIMTSGCNKH